jgi:hypothetical protein
LSADRPVGRRRRALSQPHTQTALSTSINRVHTKAARPVRPPGEHSIAQGGLPCRHFLDVDHPCWGCPGVCVRILTVLFLPSSRSRQLFNSRAETLLGATQRFSTIGARGVPPFISPVTEGFHPPDQEISIRGHESAAERVAMDLGHLHSLDPQCAFAH